MLSAGFFQVSNYAKREMDKRFKELNYTLPMKKKVLTEVVGYGAKLGNMTINEMEDVIVFLKAKDVKVHT